MVKMEIIFVKSKFILLFNLVLFSQACPFTSLQRIFRPTVKQLLDSAQFKVNRKANKIIKKADKEAQDCYHRLLFNARHGQPTMKASLSISPETDGRIKSFSQQLNLKTSTFFYRPSDVPCATVEYQVPNGIFYSYCDQGLLVPDRTKSFVLCHKLGHIKQCHIIKVLAPAFSLGYLKNKWYKYADSIIIQRVLEKVWMSDYIQLYRACEYEADLISASKSIEHANEIIKEFANDSLSLKTTYLSLEHSLPMVRVINAMRMRNALKRDAKKRASDAPRLAGR